MRCGVIPMQFHFITYGMELYTNDSIPINTNIEQCMCMRASGASELRTFGIFTFLNCYSLNILWLHSLANHLYTMVEFYLGERSDQARGSVATERGEGVGGGCSPSHGRELFHFST